MAVEVVKSDGPWILMLSGVVDVFDATALHAAAMDAIGGPDGVVANLSGLDALDTSSTQVLLALKRALIATGSTLRLEGTPAAVSEFWNQAGLGAELGA
jgi:anti-anti-sigma factor